MKIIPFYKIFEKIAENEAESQELYHFTKKGLIFVHIFLYAVFALCGIFKIFGIL